MGYQDEDELSEEGFLEMLADYEKLSKLQEQYRELPHSPQRVELCREAVAVADRLEEPSEQLAGRFDLAYAYIFGDDPAKALPVCAEFMQLHQENPGELGEAEGDAVISVAMLASSIARRLPQIPLEQCKSLLAEFQDQVRAYGLGERLWQCHAGEFAMMTGDMTALEEHLDRFRAAERDDVSDCAVCETGAMAEYLLTLGRRTEAVALVEELLEKQEFCEEQPWKLLSILTDDALERNDLQAAERFSAAMVIQPIKAAADLRRVGTLLRMKGATGDWRDGSKLLKKALLWTANFWDQELLFYFYLGAASFCQAYSAEHTEIKLPPVPGFTDCPKNSAYDCAALTQWFWSRAEEIGARFDRRNGCPNYRERLKRLLNDLPQNEETSMVAPEQGQQESGCQPEVYTDEELEAVEEHIEKCFGPVETVLHELVSPDIHVDIYVVAPSEDRNYYTLLTMGMGAHRMNVPKELAEYKLERAELAIALPADWKLNQESIQDERWYWPIRLLKALARLPIVNDTWLAWGHTMDNTRPFAENTELCAFILAGAQSPVEGCQVCTLPDGDEINFYQVLPLYRNELEYKLQHDADALLDRMADISFVVRTDRRNIIR
ncbi:suppressor of fused domain protein [Anaerotruncus colihominis]|uniref:suppressor of fused domain protein n=1 Tax=Anaerotruncus colihominis TaxID=169435 RepID=UPI0030B80BDA